MSSTTDRQTVVVGVDGSPHSDRALAVAIAEARLRGAKLKVVHAYETMPFVVKEAQVDEALLRHAAQESLDKTLAKAPSTEGIDVEALPVVGEPAHALITASEGASLLVVGTRGLGGFSGLVIGSVSSKCVHHARCSVLVAR